jgi:hypothetical protein
MYLIALPIELAIIQSDSKLLSGFPYTIKGIPDNNLESFCTSMASLGLKLSSVAGFLYEILKTVRYFLNSGMIISFLTKTLSDSGT